MTRRKKLSIICAGCAQFFDEVHPRPLIAQGVCFEPKSDHYHHFLHPQHVACKHRSVPRKRKR